MMIDCPYCALKPNLSEIRSELVKTGFFLRRSDGAVIQRYLCKTCQRKCSQASSDSFYKQKKRHVNQSIYLMLVSGVSQRRGAKLLQINRKTLVHKFLLLSQLAQKKLWEFNQSHAPAQIVEFDDMETFEHTKCKPLSIPVMVEHKTRRILLLSVAQMPAKGHLAAISRKKYGFRADHRVQVRREMFVAVKALVHPKALIKSDENPHYPEDVKKHFPECEHKKFKGRRACVVGQGELKRGGFDPIFSLNHTCAKLRADMNRLFRRTWCTTKKPERLLAHLYLAALHHNETLKGRKPTLLH